MLRRHFFDSVAADAVPRRSSRRAKKGDRVSQCTSLLGHAAKPQRADISGSPQWQRLLLMAIRWLSRGRSEPLLGGFDSGEVAQSP
jgi:hypothetical protein